MTTPSLDRNTKLILRHLRFGWWSLLVFLSLGIVLETLHGFKFGYYLNTDNETRRTMWRLAHAHGTLLSVVHLAYAVTLRLLPREHRSLQRFASPLLIGAGVLLPGGFFLGGLVFYAGDPGLGILLVPVGAACFFVAVLLTALAATRRGG